MTQTITILASGTRGDVYPHLALAQGLQEAGHRVVMATHAPFRPAVESSGIAFALLEGNPSDLMTQPGSQSALTFDGSWVRSAIATRQFMVAARPLYVAMLSSAWLACRGSDAIIVGLPSLWGMHIAEALGIPCIPCLLQPVTRTRAFPSAILPTTRSLGPRYNWLTHWVMEQALWLPWAGLTNRWRRTTLQLPAVGEAGPYAALHRQPVLYGFSDHVVARPADWPAQHLMTGYWSLAHNQDWTPPADLQRWLDDGRPCVYISFGSPGTRRPAAVLAELGQALASVGARGALDMSSAGFGDAPLPPNLLALGRTPLHWLLPRVAAALHHGGAGTTATVMQAGRPMVVMPMAVDQFFWGDRATMLGVAPPALPQRELSAARLAAALDQLLHEPSFRERSQALAGLLNREDGVQNAVRQLETML